MTATIFSLLAVTFGTVGLFAWVYWPTRRQELESLGRIPLDDDAHSNGPEHARSNGPERGSERRNDS